MKILLRFTSRARGHPCGSYRDDQGIEALLRHRQATILEVRKVACDGFLDAVDGSLACPTLTGAAWEARTLGDPVATLGAQQQDLPQGIGLVPRMTLGAFVLIEPGAGRSDCNHSRLREQ